MFFAGATPASGGLELFAIDISAPIPTVSDVGISIMVIMLAGAGVVLIAGRCGATVHYDI